MISFEGVARLFLYDIKKPTCKPCFVAIRFRSEDLFLFALLHVIFNKINRCGQLDTEDCETS